MSNDVFANGRELACKAGGGKSVCAFPDVCMTPPENPATPPGVPVPYPNTGMASDTTSGSTTVKISGKEVMLKDKSYFKSSTGDEAGAAAKKGLVTSVNRGKVYYTSWSMDVKIEGENAVRHFDMTTHNHGSATNTPPWLFVDTMAVLQGADDPCAAEKRREADGCKGTTHETQCAVAGLGKKPQAAGMTKGYDVGVSSRILDSAGNLASTNVGTVPEDMAKENAAQYAAWQRSQNDPCLAARRCNLSPKDPKNCCPGQTPHHLVDDTFAKSAAGTTYDYKAAPCVCAEGKSTSGSHGMMHAETKSIMIDRHGSTQSVTTTYAQQKQDACDAFAKVFPASGCSEGCIKAQLDHYHKANGFNESTPMTGNPTGAEEGDVLNNKLAMNQARQRQGGG